MTHPVLLSVAAGSEHPLIDIDYTVFVTFAIFLIAFLIATQLLFRPYLKMRDERHAGIEGAREEANRLRAETDARLSDFDQQVQEARSKALDERRVVRTEAATRQREIQDQARADAASSMAAARQKITEEAGAARQQLLPRADELARDIASKLLGREVA